MTTKYRLAPGVKWVVGRFDVTVTDDRGNACSLAYPEAAIWDLCSRSYPYAKVVTMTAHIAELSAADAELVVRRSIDDWVERGFLEAARSPVIELKAV